MVDVSLLPVPPPWSEVAADGEGGEVQTLSYINDVTGEVIAEHPLVRLQRRQEEKRRKQEEGASEGKEETPQESKDATEREAVETQPSQISPIPEVDGEEDVEEEAGEYSDFNCKWKECSSGTKDRFYTLILRFYHYSGRAAIRFVGLSGKWKYSSLHGTYGPITRYDLFIGSQITLFGRHLTIKTTTANVCHWIDSEAVFLEKQRLWLQEKIAASGAVPVVRKEAPVQLRHVERITSTTGTKNLRRIHVQLCKLREQLCDMGLDHFVNMMPKRKVIKPH